MNNTEMMILCEGCPKRDVKLASSGSMHGVSYITFPSDKRYIIRDNPDVSWDEIMRRREKFMEIYIPKFGKYEIEQFVAHKLMEALFITKDITELLNSKLVCFDMYNTTRVEQERLKDILLKCFVEVDGDCYGDHIKYLMFKWTPYSQLKE